MALTIEQLVEEAMQLPPRSRAELVEKLVVSLDFPEDDPIQGAWASEALRRHEEIRSGKVRPIPGDEVIAEVRRIVGR